MIVDFIAILAIIFGLPAIILAFPKFNSLPVYARILVGFLLYRSLNDLVALILAKADIYNFVPMNIYTIVLTIVFLLILLILFKKKYIQIFSISIVTVYLLFFLHKLLFLNGFDELNYGHLTIGGLIFIPISILCFYDIFITADQPNIAKSSKFWVVATILTYFSGTFFLFNFADVLLAVGDNVYWSIIMAINNTIFSIFVFCIIWMELKNKVLST